MNQKQFLESGNYLIDEVKTRAEKGSPYFFSPATMRGFSSRLSELCWRSGEKIYFITSEADKDYIKHSGSVRQWTVRYISLDGNIETLGKFQEHQNLNDARRAVKEALVH
ncbi:MAG: hypothetical protein KJI69_04485 [Patescibacteria group bacterium]|nr:hypothetical protein [Patescibacteria group bacterium]